MWFFVFINIKDSYGTGGWLGPGAWVGRQGWTAAQVGGLQEMCVSKPPSPGHGLRQPPVLSSYISTVLHAGTHELGFSTQYRIRIPIWMSTSFQPSGLTPAWVYDGNSLPSKLIPYLHVSVKKMVLCLPSFRGTSEGLRARSSGTTWPGTQSQSPPCPGCVTSWVT